eukprot:TRINITY_DN2585_c0_g1_i1.p1 TRINITY_DN2585_c0_g1~~TRINITY_DN2585_c0_g1_i1.p1  ORF type:complete len:418 (-),score=170.38 TRINITY_DN2585_c0_g1_i1:79-1332(-)
MPLLEDDRGLLRWQLYLSLVSGLALMAVFALLWASQWVRDRARVMVYTGHGRCPTHKRGVDGSIQRTMRLWLTLCSVLLFFKAAPLIKETNAVWHFVSFSSDLLTSALLSVVSYCIYTLMAVIHVSQVRMEVPVAYKHALYALTGVLLAAAMGMNIAMVVLDRVWVFSIYLFTIAVYVLCALAVFWMLYWRLNELLGQLKLDVELAKRRRTVTQSQTNMLEEHSDTEVHGAGDDEKTARQGTDLETATKRSKFSFRVRRRRSGKRGSSSKKKVRSPLHTVRRVLYFGTPLAILCLLSQISVGIETLGDMDRKFDGNTPSTFIFTVLQVLAAALFVTLAWGPIQLRVGVVAEQIRASMPSNRMSSNNTSNHHRSKRDGNSHHNNHGYTQRAPPGHAVRKRPDVDTSPSMQPRNSGTIL